MKLAVVPEQSQAALGGTSTVNVMVQDPLNHTLRVSESMTIRVEAVFPSGQREVQKVTIPAGQEGASTSFRLKEPGIVELRARHERLLEGESLILVRPPEPARMELLEKVLGSPRAAVDLAIPGRSPSLGEVRARPRAPQQPAAAGPVLEQTIVVPPSRLTLRAAPQRRILADESDAATIYAFLDREAPEDIRVRLSATLGIVAPVPIRIPKGEAVGQSQWTSGDIGSAAAAYEGATPPLEFAGDPLRIEFGPPIHRLELEPSPSSISLVESATVVLRLSKGDGVPQATDRERRVQLTLEGPGELASDEVVISSGESSSRTLIRPTGLGTISLSASTAGLPRVQSAVLVGFPWLVLALSLLGGAAGGWLAMLTQKPARTARIAVGVVTGLVVYWAFVFGLVNVPPGAAVHPLGAFAIPTVGGFLGTQAFTWVLKRLGIAL